MSEYELYNGTPPHVDQDTSLGAALRIEECAETIRGRVLRYVLLVGGATDDQIELNLGLRHQTASARRRELVLLGALKDSGKRRKTSSGRWAIIWEKA